MFSFPASAVLSLVTAVYYTSGIHRFCFPCFFSVETLFSIQEQSKWLRLEREPICICCVPIFPLENWGGEETMALMTPSPSASEFQFRALLCSLSCSLAPGDHWES